MTWPLKSFLGAFVTFALMVSLPSLAENNWPEFRGPDGQGHSQAKGLPLEWGPTKNVAWKVGVPGQGWSSPVLQDGRLYLTTALEEGEDAKPGRSLRALCFEAKSGREQWDVEAFRQTGDQGSSIHRKNSHASPTPVVEGDRIYVHFGPEATACLDRNGKVVWRNDTLQYSPVHGGGGSPVVVDDLLVFSCDGANDPFVAALDKTTGRVRWKTPRVTQAFKTFSFSTPLVIEVDGRKQILSPGSNTLCAYDPKDGQEVWRVEYDGFSVVPRPVFGHGLIFIGTGFERPTVMAIRPGGQGNLTDTHVAWTIQRSAPNTPSLLLVGDELYMVSDAGVASCVDARTGKVHWQERVGGNYSASPVYADGRIYLQNETGKGVVLKPGKAFEIVAQSDLGEQTLASYALGDGRIYIRTEQHLYAFGDR